MRMQSLNPVSLCTLLLGVCVLSVAPPALAIDPGELRVVVDENASPVARRVATIFAEQVRLRTERDIAAAGDTEASYSIVLRTDKSCGLRTDGFKLMAAPDSQGRMFVIGESPSGLVAGVGKLLRMSRYAPGVLTIPETTLEDAPRMPVRGIYFATHYHNFYHAAPLDVVDRVIEELALWGANNLNVCFDMHHFHGIQDPAAQKHLTRLRHFAKTAHGLGMQFCMSFIGNEGYGNSPEQLRATQSKGIATYGVEVCPATPEGLALIGKWQAEIIDAFPQIDMLWSWPYDQGGCACEQCRPWGGNGFLKCSEQLARIFHKHFPNGKFWLSTWNFDLQHDGDYDGLFRFVREEKPDWINGFLTGIQSPNYLRTFERPNASRYPVTWFPEISMLKIRPWTWGANPVPNHCRGIMDEVDGRIAGGWAYSEGIYEDLNKFLWISYFWHPDQPVDDMLREYTEYYLNPEMAEEGVKFFHLLEETHARKDWDVKNIEAADEAYGIAQRIDAVLPAWAKSSWRWRLLTIRATIDYILKNQGHTSEQAQAKLKLLFEEIERIYYIQPNTYRHLRPVKFDRP